MNIIIFVLLVACSLCFSEENPKDNSGNSSFLKRTKNNQMSSANQEYSVPKGLKWLKSNQNPDGSWGDKGDVNLTCLCLLAFSEHGETPSSFEFGETVTKAYRKLAIYSEENSAPNPLLAIATAQCYQQSTYNELRSVTEQEASKILSSQNPDGSFKYHGDIFNLGSENICSHCLYLLSLVSISRVVYYWEDKRVSRASEKGIEYLVTNYYSANNNAFKLFKDAEDVSLLATAAACYALEKCGFSLVAETKSCVKWLDSFTQKDLDKSEIPYPILTNHFINRTLFLCHEGKGDVWKSWHRSNTKRLMDCQSGDGSWNLDTSPTSFKDEKDRKIFSTALAILNHETIYMYSPDHSPSGAYYREIKQNDIKTKDELLLP